MEYLDATQKKETEARGSALVGWAVSRDPHFSDMNDPLGAFAERGWSRYATPPRYTKGAVAPMMSTDDAVALSLLRTAFLGLVEGESILSQLAGVVRVPLVGAVPVQVGTVEASAVEESGLKPIGRITFTLGGQPSKVAATIIVTAEWLRSLDPATQAAVRALLVSARARAHDAALVAALLASASPSGSADPGALLASLGNPARPYLVGGFDSLLSLPAGTLTDLKALGVGIVPTPAAAGTLIALDSAGLMVSADEAVNVEIARHADVTMDDGGSPASTSTVNLWTANLVGLRAERFMKFAVRAGAAAYASTGSPA